MSNSVEALDAAGRGICGIDGLNIVDEGGGWGAGRMNSSPKTPFDWRLFSGVTWLDSELDEVGVVGTLP